MPAAHYLIDELLPLLRDFRVPDIEILIVGRDPSKSLCEKAEKYPQVTVTRICGRCSSYLEQAAVLWRRFYASGGKNKGSRSVFDENAGALQQRRSRQIAF